MARGRGKRIAVLLVALGAAAVGAAGWSLRGRIAEEWAIWRLPSRGVEDGFALAGRLSRGGPRARRAAEDWYIARIESYRVRSREPLEAMGTARAVPALLRSGYCEAALRAIVARDPAAPEALSSAIIGERNPYLR